MVLALDNQNRKARYLVDEFDQGGHNEDESQPKQAAAASPPADVKPTAPARTVAPAAPQGPPQQGWAAHAQPNLRSPAVPVSDAETAARHGALASEVERLANEKSALETALHQERALIEAALRRKSQLNTEIAKAQSTLNRHEGDMATVEHQRRTELEVHLQQLTANLRELQSHTAAAKADLELARAERQALEQTLQKLRTDIGAMAQSRADEEGASSSEREKALTDLGTLQAQASEASVQLEDARAQFENNVSVWEDRISRLRTEIEQLETQRAKLLKSSRA
jgi:chromosome segregation ATPase